MAAIDDFKANLIGGGARANQFKVFITWPAIVPDTPVLVAKASWVLARTYLTPSPLVPTITSTSRQTTVGCMPSVTTGHPPPS